MPRPRSRLDQRSQAHDLPPPGFNRWVPFRKWQVVAAIRAGQLSLEDACDRYALSVEEFEDWARVIEERGFRGLRLSQIRLRRSSRSSRSRQ